MSNLHPYFEEILRNALPTQIERERNKVVKPREWHPEKYMEYHENRDELQERFDDYGRRY